MSRDRDDEDDGRNRSLLIIFVLLVFFGGSYFIPSIVGSIASDVIYREVSSLINEGLWIPAAIVLVLALALLGVPSYTLRTPSKRDDAIDTLIDLVYLLIPAGIMLFGMVLSFLIPYYYYRFVRDLPNLEAIDEARVVFIGVWLLALAVVFLIAAVKGYRAYKSRFSDK
jgi:hypothetical protein